MPSATALRLPASASSGRPPPGNHPPRQKRARTCLNGKLVYGDGAYTADCAIRDLSEGGARVTLPIRQFLPVGLYLIVVRNCVAHEAKIVWLKFPSRGLQFLKSYSLADTLPDELTYLRKLWGELYAHAGWDTQLRAKTGWESLLLRSHTGWDATDILV